MALLVWAFVGRSVSETNAPFRSAVVAAAEREGRSATACGGWQAMPCRPRPEGNDAATPRIEQIKTQRARGGCGELSCPGLNSYAQSSCLTPGVQVSRFCDGANTAHAVNNGWSGESSAH